MPLSLGQIVYTSFTGIGFRLLASAQVPSEIQQAFVEQVVFRHWDSYNPPESEYRAVYLYQVTPEHILFGWLYSDGSDDLKRTHVPYFHCYYDEDTNLIEACLTLTENLELSQIRQPKDQPLERIVGAIKNLFSNKSEDKC